MPCACSAPLHPWIRSFELLLESSSFLFAISSSGFDLGWRVPRLWRWFLTFLAMDNWKFLGLKKDGIDSFWLSSQEITTLPPQPQLLALPLHPLDGNDTLLLYLQCKIQASHFKILEQLKGKYETHKAEQEAAWCIGKSREVKNHKMTENRENNRNSSSLIKTNERIY